MICLSGFFFFFFCFFFCFFCFCFLVWHLVDCFVFQDTLIVWQEPDTQRDVALSFQEAAGCVEVW